MRIACLQFAPQVGDVDNNLSRADAILEQANPKNIDLLVLPELAFSGYNFKSLNHISPYLEYSGKGISSLWAQNTALKYDCVVTVGYPESVDITDKWPADPEYYNSSITYNADGEAIVNYRKTFLYHTDETWALEGPDGFYDGVIPDLGSVVIGICMDLNPYRFQAPFHAWEFANHILYKDANLVILSMAWIMSNEADSNRDPKEPDMDVLAYWLSRLEPVIRNEQDEEIIVVFANRCGVEDDTTYAGTSAVLGIEGGEVRVYGVLGCGENELLVVDTSEEPRAKLVTEQCPAPWENRARNSSAPSSGSVTPEHEDLPASIDAILSGSKPISPVEPRFSHAYFGPEPPRAEDLLCKLSSSAHPDDVLEEAPWIATSERTHSSLNSASPSISSSAQVLDKAQWSAPSQPTRSSWNSTHSSIVSSVQSSMPPSMQSSIPSSDYSTTMSSVPTINRPDSRNRKSSRSGTPQWTEPTPDVISRNGIHQSLVIPMATVNLNGSVDDIPSPASVSSMTTNVTWNKDRDKEEHKEKGPDSTRTEEKLSSRQSSPFIAALQQQEPTPRTPSRTRNGTPHPGATRTPASENRNTPPLPSTSPFIVTTPQSTPAPPKSWTPHSKPGSRQPSPFIAALHHSRGTTPEVQKQPIEEELALPPPPPPQSYKSKSRTQEIKRQMIGEYHAFASPLPPPPPGYYYSPELALGLGNGPRGLVEDTDGRGMGPSELELGLGPGPSRHPTAEPMGMGARRGLFAEVEEDGEFRPRSTGW